MYIKNQTASLIFKALFLIVCALGLFHFMGPGKWSSFNYYTVQSNAVCFVYFLISFIQVIRNYNNPPAFTTLRPRLEGAVVFCILITFLIYNTLLLPVAFSMGSENFWTANNLIVHYIVPIMALLDWALFCPKGVWKRTDPLMWLLIPLAYFVFIIVRAPLAGNIGQSSSPYPYPFIDVQQYGWNAVLRNVLMIAVALAVLAYILYFIDLGLSRLARRKK